MVDIKKKDVAKRKEGSPENEKRYKYFVESICGEGGSKSEARAGSELMDVLDSLPFYAMLIDSDHNILFANSMVSKALGVTPEEITGKYCPEIVHGLDGPYPGCPLEESVKGGGRAIEKEFFDTESNQWYVSAVYPTGQKTKNGKLVFFHTTRNITERKNTEAELRQLEEFHERVVNGITDAISVVNISDFKIVGVNKAFLDICGLSEEEVIGKTCHEVTHHRDSPCLAPDGPCPIGGLLETGKPITLEHVHLDKDKRKKAVEVSAHPIYEGEEIKQIVHIARDITERKRAQEALTESEQLFRGIFDNATDGILLTDMESKKFFTANETMCQMLGYGLEEIESLGVTDIHPEGDLPYVLEQFERLGRGEIKLAEDVPIRKKDGGVFYADISSAQITIAGKTYVVGLFRDITKRKKAERELSEAYEELKLAHEDLRSLDKLKSDIIANVSHELRTPITIAGGALELAREEDVKEERNRLIKLARDSLMHQDFIVEDLIDAASLVEHKKKFKSSAVNLVDAISFVKSEMEPIALGHRVRIDANIESDLPMVRANYMQLNRVLKNLINNAIKFSKEGGKVVIEARELEDMVEISVVDTGIGIPESEHEKIFEQLYQIDASATRQFGGTGMGLAVAKEIVETHGGEIRVESRVNGGSTFFFTLPVIRGILT